MVAAVFKVALFGCRQKVVVASGCEHSGLHTAFHTTFQLDIIIKFDVRPIVHQLYHFVFRTYSVDTSESLYDAHGVPVNIVVDDIVAVLKVLALGNTVGGYEHVYLFIYLCLLRTRREG